MFSLRWRRSRRPALGAAAFSPHTPLRVRPFLEPLEERSVPATLTGLTFQAAQGFASNVVVATLDAPDPGPGGFFAIVNWGDGAVSVGTVLGNSGHFVVTASHNYTGFGTFKTLIGIDGVGPAPSFSLTATGEADVVTDVGVVAVSAGVAATQNQTVNGPVATFTDLTTNTANPNAFSASVSWGDGSTTPGTVSAAGNTLTVSGSHQYTTAGGFPLFVTLIPTSGTPPAIASGVALVNPSPFSLQPATVHAAVGLAFANTTLATFTYGNRAIPSFSATVSWGDGTAPVPVAVAPSGATFSVLGGHTYAAEGNYVIHVTVNDGLGNTFSVDTGAVVGGFLTSLYKDVLNRAPDPGLAYWDQLIAQGASHAAIATAFQRSAEAETIQVGDLYTTLLHRSADPGGLAFWAAQLQAGAATQAVVLGLMTSPEYLGLHPLTAGFVAGAYQDLLGRGPSPDELSRGVTLLTSGGVSPSVFLQLLLSSPESYRQAIVADYVAILRRTPSAAEAQGWLTLIESGALSPVTFGADLYGSPEYNAFATRSALV